MISFDELEAKMAEAAQAAVEHAAEEVLRKSNEAVPVLTGDLRNSGKVTVEGNTAAVSYDTPYAAAQHETNRTNKKFLETSTDSAAADFGSEYIKKLGT